MGGRASSHGCKAFDDQYLQEHRQKDGGRHSGSRYYHIGTGHCEAMRQSEMTVQETECLGAPETAIRRSSRLMSRASGHGGCW
jgi:hypothetical protein